MTIIHSHPKNMLLIQSAKLVGIAAVLKEEDKLDFIYMKSKNFSFALSQLVADLNCNFSSTENNSTSFSSETKEGTNYTPTYFLLASFTPSEFDNRDLTFINLISDEKIVVSLGEVTEVVFLLTTKLHPLEPMYARIHFSDGKILNVKPLSLEIVESY